MSHSMKTVCMIGLLKYSSKPGHFLWDLHLVLFYNSECTTALTLDLLTLLTL